MNMKRLLGLMVSVAVATFGSVGAQEATEKVKEEVIDRVMLNT